MDGAQLYSELQQKTRMVDAAVSELRKRGTALAEAERDYRIAKAEAMALNAYKLQARLIEGQIQREWEQARRT